MKKTFIIFLIFMFIGPQVYGQTSQKFSDWVASLTPETTPPLTALLYLLEDPSGAKNSKYVTVGNLFAIKIGTVTDGKVCTGDLSGNINCTTTPYMVVTDYVVGGIINQAVGGTGVNSLGLTGYPYITAGVWSNRSASNVVANLGLNIGINVQAYSANLTTYAGIAPHADSQTLLAHSFAQMLSDIGAQAAGNYASNTLYNSANSILLATVVNTPAKKVLSDAVVLFLSNATNSDIRTSIGAGTGDGNVSSVGTPAVNSLAVFNSAAGVKGITIAANKVMCTNAANLPVACTNVNDVPYVAVSDKVANSVHASNSANTLGNVVLGTNSFLGRKTTGEIGSLTSADFLSMGFGSMITATAADYVSNIAYNAVNAILISTVANTPVKLTLSDAVVRMVSNSTNADIRTSIGAQAAENYVTNGAYNAANTVLIATVANTPVKQVLSPAVLLLLANATNTDIRTSIGATAGSGDFKADGTVPMTGALNMNSQTIVNMGGMNFVKSSGVAGDLGLYEAQSTAINTAGFRGPAALTYSYRGNLPSARATAANMVQTWSNIAETGTGSNSDPFIQPMAFTSLDSYALLASPVFSGTPNMPTGTIGVTQSAGSVNQALATTNYTNTAISNRVLALQGSSTNQTITNAIINGAATNLTGSTITNATINGAATTMTGGAVNSASLMNVTFSQAFTETIVYAANCTNAIYTINAATGTMFAINSQNCNIGITNAAPGASFTLMSNTIASATYTQFTTNSSYKYEGGTARTWSNAVGNVDLLSCVVYTANIPVCGGIVNYH